MRQSVREENQFVVGLLTKLHKDHFSLTAWWSFLVRSWNMSCETAKNASSLTRSYIHVTLLFAVLTCLISIVVGIFESPLALLRLLPGCVVCLVWQQCDWFWHLGLNRQVQTGELLPTIGIANTLTGLRGLSAAFLLGRLLGGLSTSPRLALAVFIFGVVTDILDGHVARKTHTQSRLGQIIDGETDFCLYLALIIILMQEGFLPLWVGTILILRFFVPLIAAIGSYFLFAQPVHFGSTIWGKCAGLAQCLYFFVLLAPLQFIIVTRVANFPLLVATIIFTIAAPIAQIVVNVGTYSSRSVDN